MKNYLVLRGLLLLFCLLKGVFCFGQQKINNLIFNSTENIVGLKFTPENDPDLFYTGKRANSTIGEGIAHAENEAGEIVFWVNSSGVYDKNGGFMPGSAGILAHPSSTEIVVCPFPDDPLKYYIFYNNQLCSQLYYSVVDLNLRNGAGDISHLNVPLASGKSFAEGLEIIRIPCTRDYWLVAFECEKGIGKFRVSGEGVVGYELIHSYIDTSYTGRGELDFHQGKLGIVMTFINEVLLCDFDPVSGKIDDPTNFIYAFHAANGAYGLEFSPGGSKIYVSDLNNSDIFGNPSGDNLFSYDLENDIAKSWNITNSNLNCPSQMEGMGQIEQGKDGNLYVPQINGCQILVIEDPDSDDPQFRKINVSSVLSAGISDHVQSDFLDESLIMDASIKVEGGSYLCSDEQKTLFYEGSENKQRLQWYKDGALIPGEEERTFTTTDPGLYSLYISNASGCSIFSNEIQIEDAAVPDLTLKDRYEGCEGTPLEISTGMEGYLFYWSNGQQGSSATFSESGTYDVVISNESCSKTRAFEVLFHQNKSYEIPNVFTPNNDPQNEFFEIKNLEDPISLWVYNRWGELVYFSEEYANNWNGGDLKKGTYFYKIEPHRNCGEKQMGWVLIM